MAPRILGPECLFKIVSVKLEIFLLWMNVIRTMLSGQMSPWQLESVKDGSRTRNLTLKFGQNQASNSWDIANIEFLVVGGWWWLVVLSHFCVKPKLMLGKEVELMLNWVFDNYQHVLEVGVWLCSCCCYHNVLNSPKLLNVSKNCNQSSSLAS